MDKDLEREESIVKDEENQKDNLLDGGDWQVTLTNIKNGAQNVDQPPKATLAEKLAPNSPKKK